MWVAVGMGVVQGVGVGGMTVGVLKQIVGEGVGVVEVGVCVAQGLEVGVGVRVGVGGGTVGMFGQGGNGEQGGNVGIGVVVIITTGSWGEIGVVREASGGAATREPTISVGVFVGVPVVVGVMVLHGWVGVRSMAELGLARVVRGHRISPIKISVIKENCFIDCTSWLVMNGRLPLS
jgi:hypothetical protein